MHFHKLMHLYKHGGFVSLVCMFTIFCYITVETMNETVAALYNITEFYSGECCWIPISPFSVNPALFLPFGITAHSPVTRPLPPPPIYGYILT